MRNRIHLGGGESVALQSVVGRSRDQIDPRALLAVLASLGVSGGHASQHQQGWSSGPFAPRSDGRVLVGVDISSLPNADGSAPKVEWLPLTPVAGIDIVAAATNDYTLTPTKYFRPGPLVIADTIAANLVMSNLLIGGKPVFAGSGAVPCVLFSHLCVMNSLNSYVATNSAPITFTLKNVHASATQTTRGVWVGDTQELQVG